MLIKGSNPSSTSISIPTTPTPPQDMCPPWVDHFSHECWALCPSIPTPVPCPALTFTPGRKGWKCVVPSYESLHTHLTKPDDINNTSYPRGNWHYLGGLMGGSPLPENISRGQSFQEEKRRVHVVKSTEDPPVFGDHGNPITCMNINSNNVFTAGRDGTVQVWQPDKNNVRKGQCKASIIIHNSSISCIASNSGQPQLQRNLRSN